MRLWVKEAERRPEPEPMRTDDRRAILAGMTAWVAGLGGLLLLRPAVLAARDGWWLETVLIGLGIGVVLLVASHLKRG